MVHTKGPWTLDLSVEGPEVYSESGSSIHNFVGRCFTDSSQPFQQEQIANARLIAASPDLLEACKKTLAVLDGLANQVYFYDLRFKLSEVIAKAEGK